MVPYLPLLSCESSVSVKENPDRKKKKKVSVFCFFFVKSRVHFTRKLVVVLHKVLSVSKVLHVIYSNVSVLRKMKNYLPSHFR